MILTGKGNPPRRWVRWVRWAAGGCIALAGLGGLALVAATSRPGWYQPATVGPEDYPVIRNEIPTFGGAIGTYMERGQPFRITLQDDQVNRWIAARGEIWPGLRDALPPEIVDPVVSFQPGRIVLGVQYEGSKISSVLSLAVNLEMDGARGAIRVKVDRLRAGHLPVPRMLVDEQARKALDRAAGRHIHTLLRKLWSQAAEFVPASTSQKDPPARDIPLAAMLGDIWEFRLPARNRWPNGGFVYTISDLRIEQGKLSIDVVPAPRRADKTTQVRGGGAAPPAGDEGQQG